jgi:hypothetical protein
MAGTTACAVLAWESQVLAVLACFLGAGILGFVFWALIETWCLEERPGWLGGACGVVLAAAHLAAALWCSALAYVFYVLGLAILVQVPLAAFLVVPLMALLIGIEWSLAAVFVTTCNGLGRRLRWSPGDPLNDGSSCGRLAEPVAANVT